jgi:hypothetical protein
MASVTLAESAKLAQDDLVAGVIENVITVNQMFELLPFDGIDGNSLAYNRENVLGDVQMLGVGGTITAKAAATFTKVNSNLTSIIGDAEVNGLIQATRSSTTDQEATQVASKAKSAGRQYQDQLINGDGTGDEFSGLLTLCASGQKAATGNNGSNLSFEIMDELLDLVLDKDGVVDYMAFPARTIRAYKALLRGLGGASIDDMYELPSGARVIAYSNVPIFRNDWIPVDQTKGGSSATTTIFAGTLDDGSRTHGIAGLTAANSAGIVVEDVGIHQTRDETITRVKWYCGLALFNEKGLALADGIKN